MHDARIRLDLLQTADKVHLVRLYGPDLLPQSRADVQDREHDEGEVVRHKRRDDPVTLQEDFPSAELQGNTSVSRAQPVKKPTYKADHKAEDRSIPRRVRLKLGSIGQCATVEALQLEALVKADVCHTDAEPCHQTGNSCIIRVTLTDQVKSSPLHSHVTKGRIYSATTHMQLENRMNSLFANQLNTLPEPEWIPM